MPAEPQELLDLLHAYALRSRRAEIDLRDFAASLPRGRATADEVLAAVQRLSASGALVLREPAEGVRAVSLPDFPAAALTEQYRKLTVDASLPFPTDESAPIPIAASDAAAVDVADILGPLMKERAAGQGIVKLIFPDGLRSLVVPRSCLETFLIDAAALRISAYLQEERNSIFIQSKLAVALRGSELLMRQSLEEAATRPKKAAAGVLAPSDFGFRFWTQLCSVVLLDMGGKTKLEESELALCQSAHILSRAVFHRREERQREQERAADSAALDARVRKAPFLFSEQELFDLADDRGVSYASKHGQDFLRAFIAERTRPPEEGGHLPALVRLRREGGNQNFFIHRDLIVPVFLDKLTEAAASLRVAYVESWTAEMREDRTPRETRSDALFRADLEKKITESFPLLALLADGDVLYAAADSPGLGEEPRAALARCFLVESILRPFHEMLGLSRADLLKDARANLPFWQAIPLISGIVRMLRRLLRGRPQRENAPAVPRAGLLRDEAGRAAGRAASEPGARTADARGAPEARGAPLGRPSSEGRNTSRSRVELRSLLAQYVPEGRTVDGELADLAEKWNPLFEPEQKLNLVDDVNALVRDVVRQQRRSLLSRQLDQERIRLLARQICDSRNLQQIKKKEHLLRYVELYVMRTLQAGL